MSEPSRRLTTLSPDGYELRWATWDGDHSETLHLSWDNEAWTAVGRVGRERVEYVLRLAPTWHVRQFLLFRDLDDLDLWLGIDAAHRWGEINGSYRTEFDGCADIELGCTPFTANLYAFTFIGGPAYDTNNSGSLTGADSKKVFSTTGARATAPFIVDQHLAFSTGGNIQLFGDPDDFNNGVGQAGVRILSWRQVR